MAKIQNFLKLSKEMFYVNKVNEMPRHFVQGWTPHEIRLVREELPCHTFDKGNSIMCSGICACLVDFEIVSITLIVVINQKLYNVIPA